MDQTDGSAVAAARPRTAARRDRARRPALLRRDDVDAGFARLRAESPIHRTQDLGEPAGPDFWSITRYDDVRGITRSPDVHNTPNFVIEDYQRSGDSIFHLDPPEHTKVRLIVNKGFTPRMVERMADEVRSRRSRCSTH